MTLFSCSHAERWIERNVSSVICICLFTLWQCFLIYVASLSLFIGCDPAGQSWPSAQFCWSNWVPEQVSVMVDCLPPVLLEACVVVGASDDKLREVYQVFAFKCNLTHLEAKHVAATIPVQFQPGMLSLSLPCFLTVSQLSLSSKGRIVCRFPCTRSCTMYFIILDSLRKNIFGLESVYWRNTETIATDNWNNVLQVLMTSEFQDLPSLFH